MRCYTASHPRTLERTKKVQPAVLEVYIFARPPYCYQSAESVRLTSLRQLNRYLSRCCSEPLARPAARHQRCLIIAGVLLYLAVFLSQTSLHSTLCFLFYFVPLSLNTDPTFQHRPFWCSTQQIQSIGALPCVSPRILSAFACLCVFLTTLSVNWEGDGVTRVWPRMRYRSGLRQEGLTKPRNAGVRISDLRSVLRLLPT